MLKLPPSCVVTIHGDEYSVQTRHYEELRDMLDNKQSGWVELDSVYGDGKVFVRLEDIGRLVLATESFCIEKHSYEIDNA